MQRFLVSLLLVVTLSFTEGCVRTKPLYTPEFQTLSTSSAVNAKAIRTALVARGWQITSERPGRTEAIYKRGGDYSATIAVIHTGHDIKITLLSSSNLLEQTNASGEHVIHRNYNNWVSFLERDIQAEVARQS